MSGGPRNGDPNRDDLGIILPPVEEEFIVPAHVRGAAVETLTPPAPPAAPSAAAPTPARRSVVRLYFEALVSTLVVWLFGVTFLVQPVEVPTGSMLNTIFVGDHLFVNRVVFGTPDWLAPVLPYRAIRRGDVVVFHHPNDPSSLYVKRVVGLPGETIEIYGTRIYVDGKELPESKALVADTSAAGPMQVVGDPVVADGATYTATYSQLRDLGDSDDEGLATLASADRGPFAVGKPFTIPDGQYFCLGDNRDNSDDSRFWGTVPRENVVGRAVFVYWSYDPSPDAGNLFHRIRMNRVGTLIQ